MRAIIFILLFNLSFDSISQSNRLFDDILQQMNQNTNKNYDTTVLVDHHFNELVFNDTSILRCVSIDGLSYEEGRSSFMRVQKKESKNYKKNAYIYDSRKNIYYENFVEYSNKMSEKPKLVNNYLMQKHRLSGQLILTFIPPMPLGYSSEVLTNSETVEDTTIKNQSFYVVKREVLIEYLRDKDKKKPSDHRIYVKSFSLINKKDFGVLHYQNDYFIASRDSSINFKKRYIDIYEKLGNHYYRKENYSIEPRYNLNHNFGYNSKGLYTIITKKTVPVVDFSSINSLEEIPFVPYEKFCQKVDKVSDESLKIYEKAKEFVNAPFPKFENLKKYWSE